MKKVIDHFKEAISSIRISGSSARLVENLIIEHYGVKASIKQVAQVTGKSNQISIQPWDKGLLKNIEKACSELKFNLVNNGKTIILTSPPLSEERRQEFIKLISTYAEEAKISIRNARRGLWDDIQEKVRVGELTNDDKFDIKKKIQKEASELEKQIDDIASDKIYSITKEAS